MLLVFAVTLFVSATLLFVVQPMVGKMILPLMGGTPSVWNTCMVFFQALLLAGYTYAHFTTTWLGPRRQAILHLGLLLVPLLALPIVVNKELAPQGAANPIFGVLFLLLLACGLPFFVVATSAPLLQKWFADTPHPAAKDPYFLYGASNLGSMLALISYPLLMEPYSRLASQSSLWAAGYVVLALLTALCAVFLWLSPSAAPALDPKAKGLDLQPQAVNQGLPTSQRLRWIMLAFVPSSLMLGVTTYITTDLAAIPLLWILPLILYLLSFILVFSRLPLILHTIMTLALPIVVVGQIFITFSDVLTGHYTLIIGFHLLTLFVVAMVCHGELAHSRPPTAHLTEFYLLMSLGGVLGGLFNTLVAPLLFDSVLEYPLALTLACMLMPRLAALNRTWLGLGVDAALLVFLGVLTFPLLRWVAANRPITLDTFYDSLGRYGTVTIMILVAAAILAYLGFGRSNRLNRSLDVLLAVAVGLLFLATLGSQKYLHREVTWLQDPEDAEVQQDEGGPGAESRVDPWRAAAQLIPYHVRFLLVVFGIPMGACLLLMHRPMALGLGVGALLIAGTLHENIGSAILHRERDFFGILTVKNYSYGERIYHSLIHGNINHGVQRIYTTPDVIAWAYVPAIAVPPSEVALTTAIRHYAYLEMRHQPIAYFHPETPIGQLFASLQAAPERKKVAITGLGTGGLSGFGRPGDRFTYFEIDPAVERIARDPRYFTYLQDSIDRGVDIKVILGDARLQLEKYPIDKPEDKFNIVIFDAFTSDAIPVHLVNYNALEVYLSKLADHGIVVFHVSNRYVNLIPVLARMKEKAGLAGLVQEDGEEELPDKYGTSWVILARDMRDFGELAKDRRWTELNSEEPIGLWTDDFSNLLGVFNWR
jgi:hypothetical protein